MNLCSEGIEFINLSRALGSATLNAVIAVLRNVFLLFSGPHKGAFQHLKGVDLRVAMKPIATGTRRLTRNSLVRQRSCRREQNWASGLPENPLVGPMPRGPQCRDGTAGKVRAQLAAEVRRSRLGLRGPISASQTLTFIWKQSPSY